MLFSVRNFLSIFVVLCIGLPAAAQNAPDAYFDRDNNISVKERIKPEYQTEGIKSGAFIYKPAVDLKLEYDDNVFASQFNEESDFIAVIAPRLQIQTNTNQHELRVFADVESKQYFDFGDESHTNFGIGTEARLDVKRDFFVAAGANYRDLHEGRTATGAVANSLEPISLDRSEIFVRAYRETGRTRLQAKATYRETDFKDALLRTSLIADQDFRDRDDWEFEARGDYAVSPNMAVFGRIRYVDEDYQETHNAITRDQDGFNVEGGVEFDITSLARGEVGVGLLTRSYDNPNRDPFNSIGYRGQVEWFPTPLITVTVDGARRVRPSDQLLSSSIVENQAGIVIDYEMRRHVVLSAGTNYRKEDFREIDRNDKTFSYFLEGSYLVNRYIELNAGLVRMDRDSDGIFPQASFDKTQLVFGVTLRR